MNPNASERRAALALKRRKGVVGVFFGRGAKDGSWTRENCIVVHVRRKVHSSHLRPNARILEPIAGRPVDVVEVGAARPHALDVSDSLSSPGPVLRTGSFTALLAVPQGAVTVSSGHVCSPFVAGTIAGSYEANSGPAVTLTAVDEMSGVVFQPTLRRAGISSRADWAIAHVANATGTDLDTRHPAIGTRPPFALRTAPLSPGVGVMQYSWKRGRVMRSAVVHESLTPVDFDFEDGTTRAYVGVVVVAGPKGTFSTGGDSGSLVFDDEKRALGLVLGGSTDGSKSYLLRVETLRGPLGTLFNALFT